MTKRLTNAELAASLERTISIYEGDGEPDELPEESGYHCIAECGEPGCCYEVVLETVELRKFLNTPHASMST